MHNILFVHHEQYLGQAVHSAEELLHSSKGDGNSDTLEVVVLSHEAVKNFLRTECGCNGEAADQSSRLFCTASTSVPGVWTLVTVAEPGTQHPGTRQQLLDHALESLGAQRFALLS